MEDSLLEFLKGAPVAAVLGLFCWKFYELLKSQFETMNRREDGMLALILNRLEGCGRRDAGVDRREAGSAWSFLVAWLAFFGILLLLAVAVGGCVNRSGSLVDADSKLTWSNTHFLSKSDKTGTDASYVWGPDGSGKYSIAENGTGENASEGLKTIEVTIAAALRVIEPYIAAAAMAAVKEALTPKPETGQAVSVEVKKEPTVPAVPAGR